MTRTESAEEDLSQSRGAFILVTEWRIVIMAKMTFEQYAKMYSSYMEYLNEPEPKPKEPEPEPKPKEPEPEPEPKEPEPEPKEPEPEPEPKPKEPESNAELIEAIMKLTEAMGKPRPMIPEGEKVTIEDVIKKII